MILHKANGQKTDRARKYIIKVIKDLGFQLEIETNVKELNFLDVTFNLNSRLYKLYKNRTASYFILRPRLISLRQLSNNFRVPSIKN